MKKKFYPVLFSGAAALTLAACGNAAQDTASSAQSAVESTMDNADSNASSLMEGSSSSSSAGSSETASSGSVAVAAINPTVSLARAVDIFQEEYPDAQIEEVDFDSDAGTYSYEISGADDQNEIELEIDAETEAILKQETEALEGDHEEDQEFLEIDEVTAPNEVIDIAQNEAGTGQTFEGWHLDMEDGTPRYEVEFEGMDGEIHIHAENGEILP